MLNPFQNVGLPAPTRSETLPDNRVADQNTVDRTPLATSLIPGGSTGNTSALRDARAERLFPFIEGGQVRLRASPVVARENPTAGQPPVTTRFIIPNSVRTQDTAPVGATITLTRATPTLANPSNVAGGVTLSEFGSFHSAHQLEFLAEFGVDRTGGGQTARTFTLVDSNGQRIDAVRSQNGREIFILQQLTKSDLALLSRADQQAVAIALESLPAATRSQLEAVLDARSATSALNAGSAVTVGAAVTTSFTTATARINALFEPDPAQNDRINAEIATIENLLNAPIPGDFSFNGGTGTLNLNVFIATPVFRGDNLLVSGDSLPDLVNRLQTEGQTIGFQTILNVVTAERARVQDLITNGGAGLPITSNRQAYVDNIDNNFLNGPSLNIPVVGLGSANGLQGAVNALVTENARLVALRDNPIANPITSRQVEIRAIFNAELEILATQSLGALSDPANPNSARAGGLPFLSQSAINERIQSIETRAERADAFFVVASQTQPPNPFPLPSQATGVVNSLDDNAGIIRGLDNFIAQEQRILDLQRQRVSLAENGSLSNRSLDGPTLISILQLNYNLEREAEVAAATEQVQQQNALLRTYAELQRIVNEVLGQFETLDPANTNDADGAFAIEDQRRNILGTVLARNAVEEEVRQSAVDAPDNVRRVLAFFDDTFAAGNRSPIERLINPNQAFRPLENLADVNGLGADPGGDNPRPTIENPLNFLTQAQWSSLGTRLSETVTLINQESQILTNEISTLNRERNRHFDLANNSLRRLNDSLQTLARI